MRSYKLRCKCGNCFQANIKVECTAQTAQNLEVKCTKCGSKFLIKDGNKEYSKTKTMITKNKLREARIKKEKEDFEKGRIYFEDYVDSIDEIFAELDASNYVDFKFKVSPEYWKEYSLY